MAITPITKKQILYSDFGRDMVLNPVSSDVSRKTNEEAIKESIRNLILTNRGERLFQPFIGSDILASFFENIDIDSLEDIKSAIQDTIEIYEPRCNLISVDVFANYDSNAIVATIVFNVINRIEPVTLEVILDRIR
jgi:phage baseplate assembly protein W